MSDKIPQAGTAASGRRPGRSRPAPDLHPRSRATQLRILAAARRLFASEGYDRTTIRSVAAEAEIDPAMVMRYYGSKDGLFAAAAEFDLRLPDLTAWPYQEFGSRLVGHFLDRWEGPDAGEEFHLLLRSAVTDPASALRLHQVFELQVAPALAAVSSRKRAKDCAALVATQMIGMGYARYVFRIPAVVKLSRKLIVEQVGGAIQRYIEFGRGPLLSRR